MKGGKAKQTSTSGRGEAGPNRKKSKKTNESGGLIQTESVTNETQSKYITNETATLSEEGEMGDEETTIQNRQSYGSSIKPRFRREPRSTGVTNET